jgi:hypothetical protein
MSICERDRSRTTTTSLGTRKRHNLALELGPWSHSRWSCRPAVRDPPRTAPPPRRPPHRPPGAGAAGEHAFTEKSAITHADYSILFTDRFRVSIGDILDSEHDEGL